MKPTNRATRRRPDPIAGDDVLAGLRAPRKYLPCKLLYDARGAELFESLHQEEDAQRCRALLTAPRGRGPRRQPKG